MPAVLRVVADVHERRSGVPRALRALGVEVATRALPVGDYVAGAAIVERKHVDDLRRSLETGRLWTQLWRAAATHRRAYLLIEAGLPARDDREMRGALLTAAARGIAVLFAEGAPDSAEWLALIARREEGPQIGRRRIDHHAKRAGPPDAERALAAIPGVSVGTARQLLDRFGSIAAIAGATPVQLAMVPGVGPRRAAAIAATLQAPREPAS